jgi:sugar phosphate permease
MIDQKTTSNKRWYRLMPVFFITYSFAYLDRANFGFAVAAGMAEDLKITSSMISLLGSMFFLGYFLFQIPGGHYATVKSAKKLIFWSLILWGGLAALTGVVNNIRILIVLRFTLGVVESAVMPAMLIMISNWFTKSERSKANSFLILGNPATMLWMSIVSGYLIKAAGWRGMFIIEGIPTVLWAVVWWKMVSDHPKDVKWLSDKEKEIINYQLKTEQGQIKPVKSYLTAFRSGFVILLCIQFALWSVGTYGFMMWLPSVIRSAPNMGIVETGWLSSIAYAFAIIGMIAVSYVSDITLNRRTFIWVSLLISSLAFLGSFLTGGNNFWLSFVLLVLAGASLCAPFGPFFALIAEALPRNVSGVSIALINSVGALGSFIGSYVVGYLHGIGKMKESFLLMSCSLFTASLLLIIAARLKTAK